MKDKKKFFKQYILLFLTIVFLQGYLLVSQKDIALIISTKIRHLAEVVSSILVLETNDYRKSNIESELIISDLLVQAAQMKADDMAAREYFSHVGPDGEEPWTWFKKVGYKYDYAGENLAVDFTESSDVTKGWINSATHKANLLNRNFTEIGIATAKGKFQGHDTTYVVQFFGKPAPTQTNLATVVPTSLAINNQVKSQSITSKPINEIKPEVAVATIPELPEGEVLGVEVVDSPTTDDTNNRTIFNIFAITLGTLITLYLIFKISNNKKK